MVVWSNTSWAQPNCICCTNPQVDCGNLLVGATYCGQQIFCIGDSVGIQNTSTSAADSTYICWDDGTVDGYAGNVSGCIRHRYNFPLDSCVGGDGIIYMDVILRIVDNCPGGKSMAGFQTSIGIRFFPKAEFTLNPTSACVYDPVSISNVSCPNSLTPTYLWNFGDGTTSTSANPGSHIYTSPGNYTVTLTVTNSCGSDSYSQTIQVRPPTVVNPVISLSNLCAPASFNPDINSQNATGFNWTFILNAGTIVAPSDSQPQVTLPVAGTYGIQVQASGCCSAPTSDCRWDTTLTVFTGPTTSINNIPDGCGPITITPRNHFNITGGTITSYNWSFPGGNPSSSNLANPGSVVYNSPGTYTISLVMNTPCGSITMADTFRVLPPTIVQPSLILPSTCSPVSFIPVINSQNATSFNWTVSGGLSNITLPTDSQPNISLNSAGTFTIQLTTQGCCTNPISICNWDTSVTVLQSVNITSTPLTDYCGSATINPSTNFVVNGSVSSYSWSFPGGSPSSSSNANPGLVVYSSPGTYSVSLTTSGPCGTRSAVDTFLVLNPTVIDPVSNIVNTCSPLTFIPTINSEFATGFSWSVVTGLATITQPTDSQPTISTVNSGTITIAVTANGCCSDPSSVCSWDTTFNVLPGPSLSVSNLPTFCDSGTFNPGTYFITGGTVNTYTWTFPGGNPSASSNQNPGSISYGNPGEYPITLTVSGSCGSRSESDTLLIGAPPVANLAASNLFGCDTLSVSFSNTSPPNQTYNWTATGGAFTNGTAASSAEPTIFFNTPGTYGISVETFSPGCPSITDNFIAVVGEAPKLMATATAPNVCDSVFFIFSSYFQLTASPSDSGYLWMVYLNGNLLSSDSSNNPPPVAIQQYGLYTVSASVWNDCDTILLTDTFTLSPPPTLVLPNDTAICSGTPILNLNATPSGGSWTLNGLPLNNQFDPNATRDQTNYVVYSVGEATCAVTDSFLVNVFGADIDAGPDTASCRNGGLLTITGVPGGGYWLGSGLVDSLIATYDPSQNSTGADTLVYVLVEPTIGCLIQDSTTITVYQPTPGSISIPDTACINQVLSFVNNQSGTQAVWSFGDNSPLFSGNSTNHTYTDPGNYTVELYLTNSFGCKDTTRRVLEVAEPPNAVFSLDTSRGCAVLPVTLNNLSNFYGATTYAWNYGNGESDTLYSPGTILFDQGPGDSTIYYIQLTASNGCGVATFLDSIVVYPIPVVDFGINYTDSCSPATIEFANTTTGRPENYYWFINGQLVSTDSTLAPQVFTTDSLDSTYIVSLVSTNFCGNDTLTKTVTIRPNQVRAFFNSSVVYGCRPLTVDFTSFVAASSTVQWDFGDGNTDIGYVVSHTFDTAGTFTVWQYVDNYCGFDSISQTIEVLAQPILSFQLDSINCGNELVQITNTSLGLQGVFWDFGDGSEIDSIRFSPGHYYDLPGTYPVTLIGVASGTGCTDTLTINANVVSYPTASFGLDDNDGCAPHTINLTSYSQNGNYYLWSLGNLDTLTGQTASYTYYEPGQFTIIHSIIDTNGCKDDTVFNMVSVYPVPVADFEATQVQPCTIPAEIEFLNLTSGGSNYLWDFENYGTSNLQDPVINFSSAAEFTATLIAINNYACQDTAQKTVKVYDRVDAGFSVADFLACPEQPIRFFNESVNANQYLWSWGNGATSIEVNPVTSYSVPGVYDVSLYANNDSVCFDSLIISAFIEIHPQPLSGFSISAVTDTFVNPSGIYEFIDESVGAVRWEWYFSDGLLDTTRSPIHRFYYNDLHTIQQVAINEFGCPDTSQKQLRIDYLGSLFIPNAFAPDGGSGESAYFIPKGVGLDTFIIEVYSPYGELVWYSNELVNGSPVGKWDGLHNGKPVPQGAYAWKVRAVFQNGEVWRWRGYDNTGEPRNTGSVNLIR